MGNAFLLCMSNRTLPTAAHPPRLRENTRWLLVTSAACLWLCLCETMRLSPFPLATLLPRLCSHSLTGAASTTLLVILPATTDSVPSLLVTSYPAGPSDRNTSTIEEHVIAVTPGATAISLPLPQSVVAGRRIVVAGLDEQGCIRYSAADVQAAPPMHLQISPRLLLFPLCPGDGS